MEQATNTSEPEYELELAGGLLVGADQGGPPVFLFHGRISSSDTSYLYLRTLEDWQPLPMLMIPRFNGSLVAYPNGTVKVDGAGATDKYVMIPGALEWHDLFMSIDVTPFIPGNSSAPKFRVDARGLLVIGTGGLNGSFDGFLDTKDSSAQLTMRHHGGWNPFPSVGPYFITPSFKGDASFNVNGTYIALSAVAQWSDPIGIEDVLTFVAHPAVNGSAEYPGARLAIRVLQASNGSDYDYEMDLSCGLKLGDAEGATVGVLGHVASSGPSYLYVSNEREWQPLPMLMIPTFKGSIIMYENGTVEMDAMASANEYVMIDDVIEWRNVFVHVAVAPFIPGNTSCASSKGAQT